MTTNADRLLKFLQKWDRAEGWSSLELCEKLGVLPSDVSKTYRAHAQKLLRWGGNKGPDSVEAQQAAVAASKLLGDGPKVSGGQPYRYRYNFGWDGMDQVIETVTICKGY